MYGVWVCMVCGAYGVLVCMDYGVWCVWSVLRIDFGAYKVWCVWSVLRIECGCGCVWSVGVYGVWVCMKCGAYGV